MINLTVKLCQLNIALLLMFYTFFVIFQHFTKQNFKSVELNDKTLSHVRLLFSSSVERKERNQKYKACQIIKLYASSTIMSPKKCGCLLIPERGYFESVMPLVHSFCLRQFCSLTIGFFRLL